MSEATTIPAMIRLAAEQHGDLTAIIDGASARSYQELLDESRIFSAALVSSGVERGDRVAIWAFNSLEWVTAFLGLSLTGAVLVPINTRFKGSEAADILRRSGATALVTVTDFLGTDYLEMLADEDLPDLSTVVIAHGPQRGRGVEWDDFVALATDEALAEVDRRSSAVRSDDLCDILFTSGTTGVAKGVVQTHGRTLLVASDWVTMSGLEPGDRYLMVNPYFHMFGLKAGILASIIAGAVMLPESVFDVDRVLHRVAAEHVTVLPGAPTIYQAILDHPDRDNHDLSSLRVAVTGAAEIPVELIRRVHDELPFTVIIAGYGLTEGGTAFATSPDDDFETIATTVGRLRPGFELRIVDGEGLDVIEGESGEILLRGGSVMSHYLDDPEATAMALSEDGWLKTGDLGLLTETGCLRIVGRSKDMFIVGGFNAYPVEIENVLLRHSAIRQAAVIGVPDARLGEVAMAFVVADSPISPEEIISWSRAEMANYKVPRHVEFVAELPVNATGKVEKERLRAIAAALRERGPGS